MLKFIDCNTSIGRWKHPCPGGYETPDELEAILDYLQVDKAVVFHALAQESHAPIGNDQLMLELAGHFRLLPCWHLLPEHTGEMLPPSDLVDQMLKQGVRIARLLPGVKGHRFSMEPWCAGSLLEELNKHHLPVLIDFMFFRRDDPDWNLLYDLSDRYPGLPIILTGWAGLASRSLFALSKVCSNLFMEISRYALFQGLEAFCKVVGAQQLIYGSGIPFIAPGVAMTTVTHAAISYEEKTMIATGNLERLIAEVTI
jgi:hypothetical protein